MLEHWTIKPLPLPRANEYLEDLNVIQFSASGIVAEVNPFFFVNESCQLLANSVKLFELGYFDCAFYSIRQAIETSLTGLYLFNNPEKMRGWKNLERGFELRNIVPELKVGKEEFLEVKKLFGDFFEELDKKKGQMNKYVHKQGYKSLYYYYNSIYAHGKSERITSLTKDFETILHDTITAVTLYRLVIDPFPILMLDDDIVYRMPDLMAESFPDYFIQKYISDEFVERYKRSKIYQGFYNFFKAKPVQNEAVHTLIHWQIFERKDIELIKEQQDLLSLLDSEAVDLIMSSLKIGEVIIDGGIVYTSETKLRDTSMVLGDVYYSKIFEGQQDYNIAHNGDYISRFALNDGITYLKHIAPLEDEEIARIVGLCEQYSKIFTETNEHLNKMMVNMPLGSDSSMNKGQEM